MVTNVVKEGFKDIELHDGGGLNLIGFRDTQSSRRIDFHGYRGDIFLDFWFQRWLEVTERIVGQTEAVLGGHLHIPGRVVSIFDVEARPIRRGKARADTEFGRKVLLGETDHGIITTYQVLEGNPSDTTLLKSGVKGHKRLFRKRLKAVAADRGFYSKENEERLKESGVKQVSIPVRGKVTKERRVEQKQPWFRRLQHFRAGVKARISLLQRKFGLKRSLMRGSPGTEIWVGQGIFTYNLWQAARII